MFMKQLVRKAKINLLTLLLKVSDAMQHVNTQHFQ